jgi:heterodisulfide reductase subunit A
VAAALADKRWSAHKTGEELEELDINGLAPRIGVFVCHCGTNIAGVVDVAAVAAFAQTLPYVVYSNTNLYSCSQDNQVALAAIIKKHQLNRIVVAACTPRTHEPVFQATLKSAGLNKYLIEMANIRNQCSWVHAGQPQAATEKSKDLVRMAVEKIALTAPLFEEQIEINQDALVIGGGLAGLTAAKNLARQGFTTYLVEKCDQLGGQANHVLETWKGENVARNVERLIREVESENRIQIYLDSEINQVEGSMGRFKTIITSRGNKVQLLHGATIIATGGSEYQPDQYLYGSNDRVMTALDLDRELKKEKNDVIKSDTVAFLQCVGSRIPERPYCSRVCCTHSVKSALRLKTINPQMEIYIVYRHIRTYGLRENLYRQAREKGIHFLRYGLEGGVEVKEDQGRLQMNFIDTTLNRRLSLTPDRLILAAAIVPPGNSVIAQAFKVPLNDNGFFSEAHVKLRPVDFATDGIFSCGLAHGPKPVDEAIAQAQAAAARAANVLNRPSIKVGGKTARIDQNQCTSCCVCEEVCPFNAIAMNKLMLAEVNPALCKGCGLCAASCRSGAALLDGFSDAEIFAQIGAH